MREQVRELVLRVLEEAGLEVTPAGEDRWATVLPGRWKRSLPVLLDLDERTLKVVALFSAAPDEGHAEVYRLLLTRNLRSGPVRFALDDGGDVLVVGGVPLAAVDERAVDELLGALLSLADEAFNQVLRTGFASYLAAEQRWRATVGLPPNPVAEP